MAIYRGPGGPGDATADAANAAAIALQYATLAADKAAAAATSANNAENDSTGAVAAAAAANASAAAALASQAAALTAQTNAETAETNAEAASTASINLANGFNVSTTTLSPGSSATASFNNSTYQLSLGLPRGDTGATGATATIAVGTTTTGSPGSSATVTNSGTSSAAVFDFSIPAGQGVPTGGTINQVLQKNSSTNYDTSWVTLSGGGSGDVVGPASATDNAVVRFDGTTGKLVQNSAVTIADTTGNITGGTYNKVTITAPATGATLTVADGKTLTANNSLTLSGTDSTTMTFPSTSATVARTDAGQTFTGDQAIAGNLTLNTQGDVRFADSDSSNWVAFQGPATVSSNVTWTLPSVDGTNGQALVTSGTGTLSWATPSGGGQFEGSAVNKAIFWNAQSIAENITITGTHNAGSIGPITVDSGYTVTINSGARWVVI